MSRWLTQLLKRIREYARRRQVRLTFKAVREMAEFGVDIEDICEILADLAAPDFVRRFESQRTGETMYVFNPSLAGTVVYLKVLIRSECVVISFHEDEGQLDDQSA